VFPQTKPGKGLLRERLFKKEPVDPRKKKAVVERGKGITKPGMERESKHAIEKRAALHSSTKRRGKR